MPTLIRAALPVLLLCWLSPVWASTPEGFNRLYDSQSDYLRAHADNPVDWYPWGEQAIAAARAENKPLFVSVGYATCYWCHVAERELYHRPEIARQMNEEFINIKIDREQRPDLDTLLMHATRELAGRAGWPNNVFLTPQLEPFYAGSYFPPEPLPDQPSFSQIMTDLTTRWQNDPETVQSEAAAIADAIGARGAARFAPDKIDIAAWQTSAADEFIGRYDPFLGGFPEPARSSRFPRTAKLAGLLDLIEQQRFDASQTENLDAMLQYSLTAMASGALFDQVGGGFHRYTVDPEWSMPHFEKMLTDNAQLIGLYARLYDRTGEIYYRWLTERSVDYLKQRLQAPAGGFFSAEDAEVDQIEGLSYVFTREQIIAALGEVRADSFFTAFELNPIPDNAAGHELPEGGVIRVDSRYEDPAEIQTVIAAHQEDLQTLLAVRELRKQPRIDQKQLADWNALVVIGLSEAYRHTGDDAYLSLGIDTGNWLWETLYDSEQQVLYHEAYPDPNNLEQVDLGEPGFLSDYATAAQAFLNVYHDTGQFVWLARAQAVTRQMLIRFWDDDSGLMVRPAAMREASLRDGGMNIPVPLDGDYIQPGGHTQAIDVLWQLGQLTNNQQWQQSAVKALSYISERVDADPAQWLALLGRFGKSHTREQVMQMAAGLEPEPEALATGPGRSEDYVTVSARWAQDVGQVQVDVLISDGFHINANPASEPFLVATEVVLDVPIQQAVYPAGQDYRAAFAPSAIAVYSGQIQIALHPKAGQTPQQGVIHVQACDDEVCLAPGEVSFDVQQ